MEFLILKDNIIRKSEIEGVARFDAKNFDRETEYCIAFMVFDNSKQFLQKYTTKEERDCEFEKLKAAVSNRREIKLYYSRRNKHGKSTT